MPVRALRPDYPWIEEASVIDANLARYLFGLEPHVLNHWARNGSIRAMKIGKRWYYNRLDIEDVLLSFL
jgi:hypothetical protein